MKRMQLFEVEDFAWFPNGLRQCMTAYLNSIHRLFHTPEALAPLLLRILQKHKTHRIIDLCSGGGGALPIVARLLREQHNEPVQVTLSDLYPNQEVAQAIHHPRRSGGLRSRLESCSCFWSRPGCGP